jgi:tetratricopeptide (TPR) repeat protein
MACYSHGSTVAILGDNRDEAIRRAEAARDVFSRLRYPSRAWDLRIMISLGEAYRAAGRYADAIAAFEKANASLVALGRENTENASTLYNNWALALEFTGRPLEAEPLFRRALDNSSAGGRDKDVSPMLQNNYARALDRLDRFADAATWADRAYEGARRVGDEIVVNQALLLRAAVYRHLGRFDDAQTVIDEAQPRFTRMYPANHVAMVALLSQREMLAEARGDARGAFAYGTEAIDMSRAAGHEDGMVAGLLLRRAEAGVRLNRLAQARDDATAALALQRSLAVAGRESSFVGLAYLTLGHVLRAAGDTPAAHDAFALAAAQLRPTVGADHPDTRDAERAAADTASPAP